MRLRLAIVMCLPWLQAAARQREPASMVDLDNLTHSAARDKAGNIVGLPGCGDSLTLKILREVLSESSQDYFEHHVRILAVNGPFFEVRDDTGRPACHAVVDTSDGAYGFIYRYDVEGGQVSFFSYRL